MSRVLGFAFTVCRYFTISSSPLCAATCNGVLPTFLKGKKRQLLRLCIERAWSRSRFYFLRLKLIMNGYQNSISSVMLNAIRGTLRRNCNYYKVCYFSVYLETRMKSDKHVWRIFQIDPAYLEQKIWFSIIIA